MKNGAPDWNQLQGNTRKYKETREIPEAKLRSTLRHFGVEIQRSHSTRNGWIRRVLEPVSAEI